MYKKCNIMYKKHDKMCRILSFNSNRYSINAFKNV